MNSELFSLALQGSRRKIRSSRLIFAVLAISFAFFIITLSVDSSISESSGENALNTYGEWYGAILEGLPEDEQYLSEQAWADRIGTSVNYGEANGFGFGVIDDTFKDIGRLDLKEGRMPRALDEIAVEANVLAELGYRIGTDQEIVINVSVYAEDPLGVNQPSNITFEHIFKVVGVLKSYSKIWPVSLQNLKRPLNGIVMTTATAEAIMSTASLKAKSTPLTDAEGNEYFAEPQQPQTSYFFTAKGDGLDGIIHELSLHFSKTRHTAPLTTQYVINSAPHTEITRQESYSTAYTAVILIITVVSVICIYVVRMQAEARQLAIFRGIGITKRQLGVMLFYETVILAVPAAIVGAALGIFITWLSLRLLIFTDVTAIRINVPMKRLAVASAMWLFGVFIARVCAFAATLRSSLIGKFAFDRKKSKQSRRLRAVMIAALSVILCGSAVYTVGDTAVYLENRNINSHNTDLLITRRDMSYNPKEKDFSGVGGVSQKFIDALKSVPGVESSFGSENFRVGLTFDGIDDDRIIKIQDPNPNEAVYYGNNTSVNQVNPPFDGHFVDMIVTDGDVIDLESTGVDMEKFKSGEEVVLGFRVYGDGKIHVGYTQFTDPEVVTIDEEETVSDFISSGGNYTIQFVEPSDNVVYTSEIFDTDEIAVDVGDEIGVTFYPRRPIDYDDYFMPYAEFSDPIEVKTKVGGIMITDDSLSDLFAGSILPKESYTVICSKEFIQKNLLDNLDEDEYFDTNHLGFNSYWLPNREFEYLRSFVILDKTNDPYAVEKSISEVLAGSKLKMTDTGEYWRNRYIDYNRRMVFSLTSGSAVAMIAAIILSAILIMEAESLKKNSAVLQALGMSRRQVLLKNAGVSVLRGVLATAAGWAAYLGLSFAIIPKTAEGSSGEKIFVALDLFKSYFGGKGILIAIGITAGCILIISALTYAARRRLLKGNLMQKLRDER